MSIFRAVNVNGGASCEVDSTLYDVLIDEAEHTYDVLIGRGDADKRELSSYPTLLPKCNWR